MKQTDNQAINHTENKATNQTESMEEADQIQKDFEEYQSHNVMPYKTTIDLEGMIEVENMEETMEADETEYAEETIPQPIDLFCYAEVSEEEKERILDYVVQESIENEDFMLFQNVMAKAFYKLFRIIEDKEFVISEYQALIAQQGMYIEDMNLSDAMESYRLEKDLSEVREEKEKLEKKNIELNANCTLLRELIEELGMGYGNREKEMPEDEARLAKFISNKEDRQQAIATLKSCKKAEELSFYIPTLQYDADLRDSDMASKEFRNAIMPFIGYQTSEEALRKLISRALKKS